MGFHKRVPDEFGIVLPRDNGVKWIKQGGGMSPKQRTLEGIYIPLGRPNHNLGHPDWLPAGPNIDEKLQEISVEDLPEEDRETFPEHVTERGHFNNYNEFSNWVDSSERYGFSDLWQDLYRFTYGLFDLLESDPRERWDGVEQLWEAIDDSFSFKYEEVEYDYMNSEYEDVEVDFDVEEYPRPEPAIKPIRIMGSKRYKGNVVAGWAQQLEGEVVFLMCPNAD